VLDQHLIFVTLAHHCIISSTCLSCRNWLKSIFLMHSCINNALWDFAWFLCSFRCWCVIFDVRYWKWAALNFFFQTILHVYLICFCMSVNLVITSMRWCSVSNKDKSCTSLIILFIASFLSTSSCLVTQCNFSVTFQDWIFSCTVWTHCRRVWSFVDIIAFTVFKEVWLSLYTLYIFYDILDSLSLHLQDVSFLQLILSILHDEWWLKSILSIFYLAFS